MSYPLVAPGVLGDLVLVELDADTAVPLPRFRQNQFTITVGHRIDGDIVGKQQRTEQFGALGERRQRTEGVDRRGRTQRGPMVVPP